MLERGGAWIEWAWVTMTADKLIETAPIPKNPDENTPMGDFELVD